MNRRRSKLMTRIIEIMNAKFRLMNEEKNKNEYQAKIKNEDSRRRMKKKIKNEITDQKHGITWRLDADDTWLPAWPAPAYPRANNPKSLYTELEQRQLKCHRYLHETRSDMSDLPTILFDNYTNYKIPKYLLILFTCNK